MRRIAIHPDRYTVFGPTDGAVFYLVTHIDLINQFEIHEDESYSGFQTVACDPGDTFEDVLKNAIPERAHILVITPQRLFESPLPEKLGRQRKLAVMACASTPTPLAAIEHFLRVIERTDRQAMVEIANH